MGETEGRSAGAQPLDEAWWDRGKLGLPVWWERSAQCNLPRPIAVITVRRAG